MSARADTHSEPRPPAPTAAAVRSSIERGEPTAHLHPAPMRRTDCGTAWQVLGPLGWETYRRHETALAAAREITARMLPAGGRIGVHAIGDPRLGAR